MEMSNKMAGVILGVLVIVVGLALFPTVLDSEATAAENATGLAVTILPLIPAIYAIVILLVGVGMMTWAVKTQE